MELVRGVNARALARRPSPPTCDQATRIVGQVAEALALHTSTTSSPRRLAREHPDQALRRRRHAHLLRAGLAEPARRPRNSAATSRGPTATWRLRCRGAKPRPRYRPVLARGAGLPAAGGRGRPRWSVIATPANPRSPNSGLSSWRRTDPPASRKARQREPRRSARSHSACDDRSPSALTHCGHGYIDVHGAADGCAARARADVSRVRLRGSGHGAPAARVFSVALRRQP